MSGEVVTTPAEQEAERLAYETFPNPPENVRTHILGDLIGKRAALSVGFVAGAAFEREQLRELLEAARALIEDGVLYFEDEDSRYCACCTEVWSDHKSWCPAGRLVAAAAALEE